MWTYRKWPIKDTVCPFKRPVETGHQFEQRKEEFLWSCDPILEVI